MLGLRADTDLRNMLLKHKSVGCWQQTFLNDTTYRVHVRGPSDVRASTHFGHQLQRHRSKKVQYATVVCIERIQLYQTFHYCMVPCVFVLNTWAANVLRLTMKECVSCT
jgi:hypothetical protein